MTFADGCVDADFVDLLHESDEQAVLVVERQPRIIRACNDAVARVLGYRPAELIGQSTAILHLDEAHFREFGDIVAREAQRGRPFHRPWRIRHRDGRVLDTTYLMVPIVDRSGTVSASVCVIRDSGSADANRRLLDLAINAIPVAVTVTRASDGRVLLANRACRAMFCASASDAIAERSVLDLYPDPGDRQRMVDRVRRDGGVDGFRIRLRRLDGSLFWASVSLRPIRYAGEDAIFATVADVTTEQEAREAEGKSRGLLEAFLENAPGHVFVKDLDDRYLLFNRQFRDKVASAPGDATGLRTGSVFSPEDTARAKTHDAEVIRTGSAVTRELDQIGPDGSRYALRVTKFPIVDSTGTLHAIGGIAIDVAAERAAREAAEQTGRNLQAIIDHAPAQIFLKDRNGEFVLMNRALRDERERLGVDRDDRKVHQPPDIKARFEDQDRRVLERAEIVTDEMAVQTVDGPRITRIIKFPVLDSTGAITAIGGIGIDITAERAALDAEQTVRRQLQAIVDNAPLYIFLKDRERNYILLNRSLREDRARAGLADEDRSSYRRHSPAIAAKFARQDTEVFDNGATIIDEVTTPPNAAGETRTLRVTKFPVFDEHGTIIALGGVSLDVSEQRALEQRLRQAQKTEAIGQLTGGIAHDFNNLLAVVLGNAELLVDDLAGDPVRRRMAELIQSAAERAAGLTERLLAFSRQQALHPTVIDWCELVDGVVALLRRTIPADIDIVTDLAPELWPVRADRGQLESCLINLAVNARDAMPRGGTLRVTVQNVNVAAGNRPAGGAQPPGGYVRLSVSDTGIGMSPEVQERAFDPFFTTKDVGKGTGLGLSMAYGFATQSGGQIAIRSAAGEGTTVLIDLPRTDPPESSVADAPVGEPDDELGGGHETVLVVEDEPMVRAFVAGELRRLGYEVIEAQDGVEALSALHARPGIALLFTDMVMPGGMYGAELARAARAIAPGIKVLFTTGYTGAFDGEAPPGGGVALLMKPYPRRDLAEYVRRSLDAAA